ncbi:MAG: aminopeptidase P family protein [Deltaproteobacteria bacterium]|nr:aminopeptidase P family protein [Deltaproteobacteria bacterium]
MNHIERVSALQDAIRDQGWAGVVLFYSRDVFYYAGTGRPSYLAVLPHDYALFARSGFECGLGHGSFPSERTFSARSLTEVCSIMFPGDGRTQTVGSELDIMTVHQARSFHKALGHRRLVDASPLLMRRRMVKDPEEIACVEKACEAAHCGHKAALTHLRPGVTELELSAAVENAQRLAGHEGIFFFRQPGVFMSRGPMASGPNISEVSGVIFAITGVGLSAAVPAGPSLRSIQQGDLVLIDIPPCVQGYHADQTRMYCAGEATDRAQSLYQRLRGVADHMIENLRPGITAGDAYLMAVEKAADLGIGESFLRFPSGQKAHFVGHGIGLEISEPPLLSRSDKTMLEQGMVLAIEIHLMERDGTTLKLEDTVCIEKSGCRVLTKSPRDISCARADESVS